MRNITVDGHCYYINNDTDFQEVLYQKCGKEASNWFRDYAKQFDNVIEQANDMFNTNSKLLGIIDKQAEEIKKCIEKIYSIQEIVVTEFKKNDNLEAIKEAIEAIENETNYFDHEEDPIEKDFT